METQELVVDERSQLGGTEKHSNIPEEMLGNWLASLLKNDFGSLGQDPRFLYCVKIKILNGIWAVGYINEYNMGINAEWRGAGLQNLLENMGKEEYGAGMLPEDFEHLELNF